MLDRSNDPNLVCPNDFDLQVTEKGDSLNLKVYAVEDGEAS